MNIFAIIPSAGLGRRMNSSLPKQYLKINGKEILIHTLQNFVKSKLISSIYIPVSKEYLVYSKKLIAKYNLAKKIELVIGGRERQDSVYNALVQIPAKENDLIVIHDAARPFIKTKHIEEVINLALNKKNVIAASKAKDTIKTGSEYVLKTLDRNVIWQVQTPQIFEYSKLMKAYQNAFRNKLRVTDDSSLMEKIKEKIYFYETNFENRKITTKEDINFAKLVLK